MKQLSVALAVHNEEQNIKACLQAVYDFADQIVIVNASLYEKGRGQRRASGARSAESPAMVHRD